jgi:hypothetical protein
VREDVMSLLRIIRDHGLQGAKQALDSGAFLPGLVGAFLIPSMFDKSSDRNTQPYAPAPSPRPVR